MNVEEMRKMKKERGYTNEQISESSGVPIGTVRKIFSGETKNPRFETLRALDRFFSDPYAPDYPGPKYDFYPGEPPVLLKEASLTEEYLAPPKGQFTAGDLDRLRGDDGRGELIDGVIYNLASPSTAHQVIQLNISIILENHVTANRGDCAVFTCPLDVYINQDDKTVVQPDIFVVCSRHLIQPGRIWGAPDLMIEILSPSTREKDMYTKLLKYRTAGVREYWLIDPKKERIIVYEFEHDDLIRLYTFHDKVPVSIWDGDCEIDFDLIAKKIKTVLGQ